MLANLHSAFFVIAATSAAAGTDWGGPARSQLAAFEHSVVAMFEWFGDMGIFCWRVVRNAFGRPYEFGEFAHQLDELGSKTLPLVMLAGAATGVVLTLETWDGLARFGARSLLPSVVVISLIKEMGPIITALVTAGRAGAGIGAELGAMKVTEQIDAMEASAVNPYRYLVSTRILACMLMMPLLTLVMNFFGILSGWLTYNLTQPISLHLFINNGFQNVTFDDLLPSTFKTVIFGLIIGLVSCFEGLRARGGTEGVERAATSSVVLCSLFVILADVVLVRAILTFFP